MKWSTKFWRKEGFFSRKAQSIRDKERMAALAQKTLSVRTEATTGIRVPLAEEVQRAGDHWQGLTQHVNFPAPLQWNSATAMVTYNNYNYSGQFQDQVEDAMAEAKKSKVEEKFEVGDLLEATPNNGYYNGGQRYEVIALGAKGEIIGRRPYQNTQTESVTLYAHCFKCVEKAKDRKLPQVKKAKRLYEQGDIVQVISDGGGYYNRTGIGTDWFVDGYDKYGYLLLDCQAQHTTYPVKEEHVKLIVSQSAEYEKALKHEKDTGEHRHAWKTKWENTYRKCHCGLSQFRMSCWSKLRWESVSPNDLYTERPDVKKEAIEAGENFYWIHSPHLLRSLDIIPPAILDQPVHIIGSGSIGSFTALAILKMGFKTIIVHDDDRVNPENLGTQLAGFTYTMNVNATAEGGMLKSEALKALLIDPRISPHREHKPITAINKRYTGEPIKGVVISAVDSMSARRTIWEGVGKSRADVPLFIDSRMGGEYGLMYCMNPSLEKDRVTFEKTLYDDKDAVQEPCTAKATIYTSMLIAGQISKALKDVLAGKRYARIVQWDIANDHQSVYHSDYGVK